MGKKKKTDIIIYQSKSGKIEFKDDFKRDTVWGNLNQIANLFGRDKSVISRHIKNIYKSRELEEKSTVAIFATVQKEGDRKINREIEYYNLDVILSVGYRVDSKQATQFRIWATKTLKQHLLEGYTINKNRIIMHHDKFLQALANVKAVLPKSDKVKAEDVIELMNAFAETWFSLEAYDKENFPKKGITKKRVYFTSEELIQVLQSFRQKLIAKKQASKLFGQEQQKESVASIIGNVGKGREYVKRQQK